MMKRTLFPFGRVAGIGSNVDPDPEMNTARRTPDFLILAV
jgi:hypothetical protein